MDMDSEDDFEWEEVQVPEGRDFEVTIRGPTKTEPKKKAGITHAERLLRIECHKLHTVCLLGNAQVRNRWLNDELLQARLLSLTPLNLQNAFTVIHKSRYPDHNQRGRMFEAAMNRLTEWWSSFFEVTQEGHIINRTFDKVQQGMIKEGIIVNGTNADVEIDVVRLQDALDDDGETIHGPKSLMKHALMHNGSRDVSAQLFTSLCRALGIPARLLVSVQSVPWQPSVGKPKPSYSKKSHKGKEKAVEDDEDADMELVDVSSNKFSGMGQRLDGTSVPEKSEKAKGKEKAQVDIKLRKTKIKGHVLGSTPTPITSTSKHLVPADPKKTPPVFWTEVFSRADTRWIPVDPIRCIVNKRKVFDPTPTTNTFVAQPSIYPPNHPLAPPPKRVSTQSNVRVDNRMLYVLAYEEDGYGRDVTRRYAREYGAKVAKAQGASGGGKFRAEWWERVVQTIRRPYRLVRDDAEDEELDENQMMEGMPTTIGGFKDHPLYVLTRHLKQTQTIHPAPPATPQLGKFRGEPVYPRSSVVSLKTPENWLRSEGRTIKEGCQAMKWIKIRAGTVGKMREVEVFRERMEEMNADKNNINLLPVAGSSNANELMQGLYARNQTEVYVPDPVVDGKVPKNNFGNIDLYVPSMLPAGGVHIPYKGIAKIARKLKLDHAEAVTGFEFKKRRAFPLVEGVVVAAENETILLEAYWESEREIAEKARVKREERVIQQWIRLVHGLRIRQRLQAQYNNKPVEDQPLESDIKSGDSEDNYDAGGFLVSADDVVQPFSLPRDFHVSLPITGIPEASTTREAVVEYQPIVYHTETMDLDSDSEHTVEPNLPLNSARVVPHSLEELATLHANEKESMMVSDTNQSKPVSRPLKIKIQRKAVANDTSNAAQSIRGKRKASTHSTRGKKRRRSENEEVSEEEQGQVAATKERTRTALPPPPSTTRTLRPRAAKSAAAIQEEREQEIAFRKAIAE